MGGMIVHRQYLTQPQGRAEIDWSNPLTMGLVSLILPSSGVDCVDMSRLSVYGTMIKSVTTEGVAFSALTNSSNHSFAGRVTGVSTEDITQFLLVDRYVGTSGKVYRYGCGTFDGTNGCGIAVEHTGISNTWGVYSASSGFTNNLLSSGEKLDGTMALLVHSRSGGTHKLYRNGIEKASAAASNGNAASAARFVHGNLQYGSSAAFSVASPITMSGRWRRALSAAEIKSFSANPWQIFRHP